MLSFQNILKKTCPQKFTSTPGKVKHFIGQFMTADNSIKCVPSGLTGHVGGFQIPGVVCKPFLPFFPILSLLFDSLSSFFDPKLHGNACNTGYENYTFFSKLFTVTYFFIRLLVWQPSWFHTAYVPRGWGSGFIAGRGRRQER